MNWRFRKQSESTDKMKVMPCGCKVWVYDGLIVRACDEHSKLQQPLRWPKKLNGQFDVTKGPK